MARNNVEFDQAYFDHVMKSSGIQSLQKAKAQEVLNNVLRDGPEDTGDYKRGLHVTKRSSQYRDTYLVEGQDRKTLILESEGGYLARALKKVKP